MQGWRSIRNRRGIRPAFHQPGTTQVNPDRNHRAGRQVLGPIRHDHSFRSAGCSSSGKGIVIPDTPRRRDPEWDKENVGTAAGPWTPARPLLRHLHPSRSRAPKQAISLVVQTVQVAVRTTGLLTARRNRGSGGVNVFTLLTTTSTQTRSPASPVDVPKERC